MSDLQVSLEITDSITAELHVTEISATFNDAIVIRETGSSNSENFENRYEIDFTEGDLSIAGVLVKQHNLGKIPVAAMLFDPSGESIGIQKIEVLTINAIAIPMNDFMPLKPGDWKLVVGV